MEVPSPTGEGFKRTLPINGTFGKESKQRDIFHHWESFESPYSIDALDVYPINGM